MDKLARISRVILLGAIAVVLGLIVMSPRDSAFNPMMLRRAQAEGSICAAPGYLMLTMAIGANSKLYLNDTNKQVLCVYEVTGDKLRLVSARKYDYDNAIFDGSIPAGTANKPIEGGNGITRDEAKNYGEAIQKSFADYKKKYKLE